MAAVFRGSDARTTRHENGSSIATAGWHNNTWRYPPSSCSYSRFDSTEDPGRCRHSTESSVSSDDEAEHEKREEVSSAALAPGAWLVAVLRPHGE